jgi:hypothetical protein
MKKLIAGPWVGEFGWELFAWSAYIRALSRNFDHTTIISRKNSKAIYDDFADEYISHDVSVGLADSFFMHGFDFKKGIKEVIQGSSIMLEQGTTLFPPRRIGMPPETHYTQPVVFGKHIIKPEYIRYGNSSDRECEYVFHIRNRSLRKEDNWDLDKWNKLRDLLGEGRIGCIGTKKEASWIPGTIDLRDVGLGRLMTILRNSHCAFGPSSGPMHLASLCGTPHVVWSIERNRRRFQENWNPLRTKVLFDSEFEWHPTAEHIHDKYMEWK